MKAGDNVEKATAIAAVSLELRSREAAGIPNLGAAGQIKARGHYADDGRVIRAQPDRATKNICIPEEGRLPQTVADDGDVGSVLDIIRGGDGAAKQRSRPDGSKEIPRNAHARDAQRIVALEDQLTVARIVITQTREERMAVVDRRRQIAHTGHCHDAIRLEALQIAITNSYKFIRVRVGKAVEERGS